MDHVPIDLRCGGPNSAYEKLIRHYEASGWDELGSRMKLDIYRREHPFCYVGPEERTYTCAQISSDFVQSLFGGTYWLKCDSSPSDGGLNEAYSDSLGIRPLQNCETVEQVENYPWPEIKWLDFDDLKEDCLRHHEYAVMLGEWTPIMSRVFELFGIETALVNLRRRPSLIRAAIKRITEFYYELFDTALSVAEGQVDIVGFGDDFATQNSLMISPEMWRSFLSESFRRLFSLGKKHNVYVYFHSCGSIREVIPDLIDLGVDILYPVQPRAKDMGAVELKAEFGDRLAFWGAIDVQKTLPFGTTEDVRREVRERIETLGKGGGYVLSSSHNLLKHFPLMNILAMYDEAIKTRPPS